MVRSNSVAEMRCELVIWAWPAPSSSTVGGAGAVLAARLTPKYGYHGFDISVVSAGPRLMPGRRKYLDFCHHSEILVRHDVAMLDELAGVVIEIRLEANESPSCLVMT